MDRRTWLIATPLLSAAAGGSTPLRVGWDPYPPHQLLGPDGQNPVGLDIDVLRAVAEQAGLLLQFERQVWQEQLRALEQGELDLLMAAARTRERARFALWSLPYRAEVAALIGVAGRHPPLRRLDSLAAPGARPVRIGVVPGSEYPGEWAEAMREPAFARLVQPYNDMADGVRQLRAGAFDYLVADPAGLLPFASQRRGEALVVAHVFMRNATHFMLSRRSAQQHPQLLERINGALVELRRSGALQALFRRYPGAQVG